MHNNSRVWLKIASTRENPLCVPPYTIDIKCDFLIYAYMKKGGSPGYNQITESMIRLYLVRSGPVTLTSKSPLLKGTVHQNSIIHPL